MCVCVIIIEPFCVFITILILQNILLEIMVEMSTKKISVSRWWFKVTLKSSKSCVHWTECKLKKSYMTHTDTCIHRQIHSHRQTFIYELHTIGFQTFFVCAPLLIVHTWNFSPLRSNLFLLQCTCCAVPTTYRRPHWSPLVWAYQWPSSQPLSSPQLSHNDDSLWA